MALVTTSGQEIIDDNGKYTEHGRVLEAEHTYSSETMHQNELRGMRHVSPFYPHSCFHHSLLGGFFVGYLIRLQSSGGFRIANKSAIVEWHVPREGTKHMKKGKEDDR